MIRLCENARQLSKLVDYIEEHKLEVPYLYTNLIRYGIKPGSCQIWVDECAGTIQGVYLQYHDCLHFFTGNDDYPISVYLSMVDRQRPNVMFLQQNLGQAVEKYLSDVFSVEHNLIFKLASEAPVTAPRNQVSLALREDIPDIVSMLMEEHIYSMVYSTQELLSQFYSRYDQRYGKCYVIRKDGHIVCSYSVYGENKSFANIGAFITKREYQGQGLGKDILLYLTRVYQEKGKSCILFINENNLASRHVHEKAGAHSIGMLYKMVRKRL